MNKTLNIIFPIFYQRGLLSQDYTTHAWVLATNVFYQRELSKRKLWSWAIDRLHSMWSKRWSKRMVWADDRHSLPW